MWVEGDREEVVFFRRPRSIRLVQCVEITRGRGIEQIDVTAIDLLDDDDAQ